MQIEISNEIYRAIAASEPDVVAFVEKAAQRALAKRSPAVAEAQRRVANITDERRESIRKDLHKYQGTLKGSSTEEICADRHQGLR